MNECHPKVFGSLIGLKEDFEERYIILHHHTFPEVLERIHKSNITDYSIFLFDHILFSHMIYTGDDFESDMQAMGTDETTREWWKLTDPMQYPFEIRNENEWWAQLHCWYNIEFKVKASASVVRRTFCLHTSRQMIGTAPELFFGDIEFWGTTYDLKCLKIFTGGDNLYLYTETTHHSDLTLLLEIICRVLETDDVPEMMNEVFHTEFPVSLLDEQKKKVFVTGCFDLLHSGHIAFMKEAATYGDLFVCIGSDSTVFDLKGRYPINSQNERKYMIDSLSCVKECRVNSGSGIIDFENELHEIRPDIFVVNEDGHTPTKQALCKDLGIEYKVLKRIPHADLPVRSTTALRTQCTIPFRIDLAGGWLDQPFVSKYHPGAVITISIEPTIEFNERSGMSSSTRRKAIELWRTEIPHGDPEQLARVLFSFENPPGTNEVAGSQDSLGIVLPGLNKLEYNGSYWPEKIISEQDEELLSWIEKNLYLVTLGPRVNSFSPLINTNITADGARALAEATNDCWNAILKKDIREFGKSFRRSFEAQIAMFPNMVDEEILETIDHYKDKAWGWKLSGAGGGGYIILVSDVPVEDAMQIKIRRKNSL